MLSYEDIYGNINRGNQKRSDSDAAVWEYLKLEPRKMKLKWGGENDGQLGTGNTDYCQS